MSGRLALGAVLLGVGVLWLLSAADVLHLSYTTWIGVLLIVIGLAIALTRGRHGVLVLAGVLVVLAGLPAVIVGDDLFQGGIGDKSESPATEADVEPFRLGIGELRVDLTSPELEDARVEASVGIGKLVVVVPSGAEVSVDAHVSVGDVEALGEKESGIDVDLDESFPGTPADGPAFDLELEAGIGNIRVERG